MSGKEALSVTRIGNDSGESREQVRRYIRLTELIPELLDLVDEGRIAFRPAVELSYLQKEEQSALLEQIAYADATPSLAQAIKLKRFSQEGKKLNAKKNTNKPEIPGKVKKGYRIYVMAVLALTLTMSMGVTAFAAGDPITVVNNLSDFIFGLIRAVGLILLGWGIVQVGLSFQSHDPSQRSNGFLTLAGGVIITFAKEILNLIVG